MHLEIARGTNPSIGFSVSGIELIGDADSYVTLRRSLEDRELAVDTSIGEVQIALKADGSGNTDADGNVFSLTESMAKLSLSRTSTQKMQNGVYFLQFNLKSKSGKLFTHKPEVVEVLFNLTDFPEKES